MLRFNFKSKYIFLCQHQLLSNNLHNENRLLRPSLGMQAFNKVESVDKPGSVMDDHSSATGVTACL